MRFILALILILTVFIDFSTTCIADDLSICHSSETSDSNLKQEFNKTSKDSAQQKHTQNSDSHHCHGAHIHAAVNFSVGSITSISNLNFSLEFFDYSLAVPSPTLSKIIRPPIPA